MLGTVISCNTCTWNNVLFECWLRRGDNVEHLTKETIVLPVICPWSRNRRTLFFLQKTNTTTGKAGADNYKGTRKVLYQILG
jgi:hypothetical protein